MLVDIKLPGISREFTVWSRDSDDRSLMVMCCYSPEFPAVPRALALKDSVRIELRVNAWHAALEKKKLMECVPDTNTTKKNRKL